ncbi:MAG: helix-turn-helix domain-containing protein [Bacteroidales bacterium]|nr:helix-turn-helix domain-containing protein [Bacteroidales bacterium]
MKKNYYPEKMMAIELLKEGKSRAEVSRVTGIDFNLLTLYWHRYQQGGHLSLMDRPGHCGYDEEIKLQVVRDCLEKGLSLTAVSLKYDIPSSTIKRWRAEYKVNGDSALKDKRKSLNKKTEHTQEYLDELEMLRKRNEYLEAENALLKKVKALVCLAYLSDKRDHKSLLLLYQRAVIHKENGLSCP